MTTTPFVYVDPEPGEALEVTITPEAAGTPLDLSTVTACVLHVHCRSTVVFWDTVISTQTAGELVVIHGFAAGEAPTPNVLSIMPYLTVPGGTRRCTPFRFQVV